ncbi:hypothetical protein [Bifidobacterium sp. UTBIF-68]|uniref:hypothetical protein n=1 Tax=Bifidobacterium sp. UTBIF-68 TaxID=1465262 RepID=UPI0015E360D5|nr:hypothetical protein [Bifidobacterium sp. UTBIF-68]
MTTKKTTKKTTPDEWWKQPTQLKRTAESYRQRRESDAPADASFVPKKKAGK